MKTTYTYTCLRYVHDVATGEFANVGVLLYAPEANYVQAKCRTTFTRLTRMFPGMDGMAFRSLMEFIESQFAGVGRKTKEKASELPLAQAHQSVMPVAHLVLPADDSSLQWSEPIGGVTDDPEQTLQRVFDRLVARYDHHAEEERRNDEAIWRDHKQPLEKPKVISALKPIIVKAGEEEHEFKRTWRNGRTNCIEMLSFDLHSPSSYDRKAFQWLGIDKCFEQSLADFYLYMILGEPQTRELGRYFDKAVRILDRMSVKHSLIPEREADKVLAGIAHEIETREMQGQTPTPDQALRGNQAPPAGEKQQNPEEIA